MTYDEFEATMQAAGWSLEEIEAAWQAHLRPLLREEAEDREASGEYAPEDTYCIEARGF